ncbi:hypothetical protein XENOCAPTIV_028439 [Xenoophorus captivus]|uniref:C2H2-type domain-containing protein n=1 Tax=Xenoophorus captivus TaxID=1517983 RepID=A0ABV0RFV9_9TELE
MKGEGGDSCGDRHGPSEGGGHHTDLGSSSSVILQPSPSSPQQDPRWTPLEDMEVFSPDDEDAADSQTNAAAAAAPPAPGPPLSPSGRRSSASMLHRLLTLPSQVLDEDEDAAAKETLIALATNGSSDQQEDTDTPDRIRGEEDEEEEEEGEEGDKGRKVRRKIPSAGFRTGSFLWFWSCDALLSCVWQKKRRRVWSECEECGRRFSRMSLLKAHRQTHATGDSAVTDTSSSSPPPAGAGSPLCCSECGKRFSSNTRLHSHIRTQHPENRS